MHKTPMRSRFRRAPRRPPTNLRGIVLLEAMIAILLFVTGLLGIVVLQTHLTRAQTENAIRSEAAYLAHELLGLMWADLSQLDGFGVGADDCTAAPCRTWLAKTRALLPGGGATVSVNALADGSVGGNVDITVNWLMPGGEMRKYMTRSTLAASHTP